MGPSELLQLAADVLDSLAIEYLVTGSMASISYGEPRFTNDIDIVVKIDHAQTAKLCDAFSNDDFYISCEAASDAVRRNGQFNLIHPDSGLKIDFMVALDDDFNRSRFQRRRRITVAPSVEVPFASPEDVILRKLEYFRDGGSDKHLRDIRGILKMIGGSLDHRYLMDWVLRLDVLAEWRALESEPS